MRPRLPFTLLLLALTLPAGCMPLGAGVAGAPGATSSPKASAASPSQMSATNLTSTAALSIVTGVVFAPLGIAGIISNNGGSVIPIGGGNVVPVGGGNVIPVGGGNQALFGNWPARHIEALSENPLAVTKVYLADSAGHAYPGLSAVSTDATGQFTFQNVPAGYTFMVVAQGFDSVRKKNVTLQTLVRSSPLGASTRVDTSTSLVTLAVTEGQGDLGEFNAAAFRTATEATAVQLQDGDIPDLSDRSAILAKISALAKQIAALQTALDAIRQDLKDIKASLAKIDQQLSQSPVPTPPPAAPDQPSGGNAQPGPGGGAGACSAAVSHDLVFTDTFSSYPVSVAVNGRFGPPMGTGTITAQGGSIVSVMPEGCPVSVSVKNAAGKIVGQSTNLVVPLGSPRRVNVAVTLLP